MWKKVIKNTKIENETKCKTWEREREREKYNKKTSTIVWLICLPGEGNKFHKYYERKSWANDLLSHPSNRWYMKFERYKNFMHKMAEIFKRIFIIKQRPNSNSLSKLREGEKNINSSSFVLEISVKINKRDECEKCQ